MSSEHILTCPYNKAHSIISSRMQFHLTKCRVQYPNAEKGVCPFNSTHIVNRVELDYHMEICGDRIIMDSFTYKVGTSSPYVPKAPFGKEAVEINGNECWDEESTDSSVLETIQVTSRSKPTLQALIGAPKSERKAFRNQERLRIQRVLDNKPPENLKASVIERKTDDPFWYKKIEPSKHREEDFKGGKLNHSYNGKTTASQGQAAFVENTNGIQKSSAAGNRKAVWGLNKAPLKTGNDDYLLETQNTKQLNAKVEHSGNVNEVTKSMLDLKILQKPGGDRDPVNPWRFSKTVSTGIFPTADQSDYPMLPVAGRGRGRLNSQIKHNKK